MVLLQTVEDLSACHYKGTTVLLPLVMQLFTMLDRHNQQLRGAGAVVKLAACVLTTHSVRSYGNQYSTSFMELLRILNT